MADDRDKPFAVVPRPEKGNLVELVGLEKFLRRMVRSEIRKTLPRERDKLARGMDRDEEIAGLVQLLAARSNDAKDEVLRKALTLYGLALDAREKGHKLAIINADDYIVHDVIGFESMVEALGSRKD